MDTTTNQKSVSAMGGTLEEACDCGGTYGGRRFATFAANEALQNTTIKQALGTSHMCSLIVIPVLRVEARELCLPPPPPLMTQRLVTPNKCQ